MTPPALQTAEAPVLPLSQCRFDAFEAGLLPVLRHFLTSFASPELQTWQFAYTTAAERWGDSLGLAAAQALLRVVRALLSARPGGLTFQDPLCLDARDSVTEDERLVLEMLHHMRRDDTPPARDTVEVLTDGRMDPDVIRAGLSFARRFPAGPAGHRTADSPPSLRVVG